MLQSQLAGESEWPALPDSEDPNTDPVREAVQPDDGYVTRRTQESLLAGGTSAGNDARQHAALLVAQLISHYTGSSSDANSERVATSRDAQVDDRAALRCVAITAEGMPIHYT